MFDYWRGRLLWSSYIGYVVYYCLRKNIPVAVPLMCKELGLEKAAFGLFFTLHDLTYGLAKWIAGMLADRYNPRFLVAMGVGVAALCNLGFSMASSVTILGVLWVANGFFQGFGFPPIARILSYWFRASERGVKWGIFNTSHQVGTFLILYLSGYLCSHYGWRQCFWVPAIAGVFTAAFLFNRLRDTPDELGLPPVESDWDRAEQASAQPPAGAARESAIELAKAEVSAVESADSGPIGAPASDPVLGEELEEEEPLAEVVRRRVYRNPAIWLACTANFFVYSVRYGILNWAPTYLQEVKHLSAEHAGLITGGFEIAGLVGCLVAGWLTDRFWAGRRAPVSVIWMIGCALSVLAFWKTPEGNTLWMGVSLAAIGFTVYGPQFLGGVMSADLAGSRAAGTAVGVHGFFGYLSGLLSGLGLSKVVDKYGWDVSFQILLLCSILGALAFVPIWNAGPVDESAEKKAKAS